MVAALLLGPSLLCGVFKEGHCTSVGTFQGFGRFQGWSLLFYWDLPYFAAFSRKVTALLLGPSRVSAVFKEGRQDLLSFDVLLATFATV